jgi:hypothetical protein
MRLFRSGIHVLPCCSDGMQIPKNLPPSPRGTLGTRPTSHLSHTESPFRSVDCNHGSNSHTQGSRGRGPIFLCRMRGIRTGARPTRLGKGRPRNRCKEILSRGLPAPFHRPDKEWSFPVPNCIFRGGNTDTIWRPWRSKNSRPRIPGILLRFRARH